MRHAIPKDWNNKGNKLNSVSIAKILQIEQTHLKSLDNNCSASIKWFSSGHKSNLQSACRATYGEDIIISS